MSTGGVPHGGSRASSPSLGTQALQASKVPITALGQGSPVLGLSLQAGLRLQLQRLDQVFLCGRASRACTSKFSLKTDLRKMDLEVAFGSS